MPVNQQFTQMPFISSVREAILESLSKGPIDGVNLLTLVNKQSPVSKQGLYKALRELVREEVVIKDKRVFYINKAWLLRLQDFIDKSRQTLGLSLPFLTSSFSGRKIMVFKTIESLDIFWGHLFLALAEQFPDKPFFFFNHHSWSIYTRPHSEMYLYKTSLKMKNKILITIGSNTLLDKDFENKFNKDNTQITIDENSKVPKTNHLCIIDDYVITTKYGEETMAALDRLFKKSSAIEKNDFSKILLNSKNIKMTIIKSKQKALVWKKRLAKNFVIKSTDL